MLTDEMVEKIARAIAGGMPESDAPYYNFDEGGYREDWLDAARAALETALPLIGEQLAKMIDNDSWGVTATQSENRISDAIREATRVFPGRSETGPK